MIQEINDKFKSLSQEDFYAWYWKNKELLIKKDLRKNKTKSLFTKRNERRKKQPKLLDFKSYYRKLNYILNNDQN